MNVLRQRWIWASVFATLLCLLISLASVSPSYAAEMQSGSGENQLFNNEVALLSLEGSAAENIDQLEPSIQTAGLQELDDSGTTLIDGHVYEVRTAQEQSDKVLDAAGGGTSDGTNVQMYSENRTQAQWWTVQAIDPDADEITLLGYASGKALDVSGGSGDNGANVQLYTPNGTAAQQWLVQKNMDGTFTLINRGSGKALDISGGSRLDGANVQQYTPNGTAAQKWTFFDLTAMWYDLDVRAREEKDAVSAGDVFAIASVLGEQKVMDVQGGSIENGGNIQSYESNGTAAQQWTVRYDVDGYATITNVKSGRVLDVVSANPVSGVNVQQYVSNGTRAQKWIIRDNGDGTFTLLSALWEGLALDIAGGSTLNGANIQIYASNNTAAQKWLFLNLNPTVDPSDLVDESEWYTVQAQQNPAYVLDVWGGIAANGTNIQLYSDNGTFAQYFKFVKSGDYYYILNGKTNMVLDVTGGSYFPGTNIQEWTFVPGELNQLFSLKQVAEGVYSFINVRTGLALTYNTPANLINVYVDAYSGSSNQCFILTPRGNLVSEGLYTLSSALSETRALSVVRDSDIDGANIVSASNIGSMGQKWYFQPVAGKTSTYVISPFCSGCSLAGTSSGNVAQLLTNAADFAQQWRVELLNGCYVLRNLLYGSVLDIAGASLINGTNVQLWGSNGTNAQGWNIISAPLVTDGVYTILSGLDTNFALDVYSGSKESGANVQLYQNNGTFAQKWTVVYDSLSDAFTLVNKGSGLALDVLSADSSFGANVQQYELNNTDAQKWIIIYRGNGLFSVVSALDPDLALGAASDDVTNWVNAELRMASSDQALWRLVMSAPVVSAFLNGIDISHHDGGLNVARVEADFVIAKATEGTHFIDSTWRYHAQQTLASGKLLGLYHFANSGDPIAQADYFINEVQDYIGKAVLVLDWENTSYDPYITAQGPNWALQFLDRIYERTGVRGMIYMGSQDLIDYDWSSVAGVYPLWYPRYLYKYQYQEGYVEDPDLPDSLNGNLVFTDWESPLIYQYSSTRTLPGYDGYLDMNIMYGDRELWNRMASSV